jgi:hypothetical protein
LAVHTFSRNDIQGLAKRLADRGRSTVLDDMPSVQQDMKSAALILEYFVVVLGVPVTPIEVNNGL